jgi:phosphatidylinositol 3-kinase
MAESVEDTFDYVYSCSLETEVEVKIGTLEGVRLKPEYDQILKEPMLKFSGIYQEGCAHLQVMCQVIADNRTLSLPVWTSYKPFTNRYSNIS